MSPSRASIRCSASDSYNPVGSDTGTMEAKVGRADRSFPERLRRRSLRLTSIRLEPVHAIRTTHILESLPSPFIFFDSAADAQIPRSRSTRRCNTWSSEVSSAAAGTCGAALSTKRLPTPARASEVTIAGNGERSSSTGNRRSLAMDAGVSPRRPRGSDRLSMGLGYIVGIGKANANTRYTESMSPEEFLPE